MPSIKATRWPIAGVPAWCPFSGVMIEWRCVEPQPSNDCECVTLARIDGDPFAGAAFAVPRNSVELIGVSIKPAAART